MPLRAAAAPVLTLQRASDGSQLGAPFRHNKCTVLCLHLHLTPPVVVSATPREGARRTRVTQTTNDCATAAAAQPPGRAVEHAAAYGGRMLHHPPAAPRQRARRPRSLFQHTRTPRRRRRQRLLEGGRAILLKKGFSAPQDPCFRT